MNTSCLKSAALLAALNLLLIPLTACSDRSSAETLAKKTDDAAAAMSPSGEPGGDSLADAQDLAQEVQGLKALTAPESDETQASDLLTATGEMVADVHSELVPRQSGRIARILADEGEEVTAGEPLLEIESDYLELAVEAARAQLAQAEAGLAEARRELDRKKELLEKDSISRAVFDRVQSAFDGADAAHEAARVNLALAEKHLEDAVLRSPIDGVVAERRVDVGESLSTSKVAYVIVRTKPLKLRFLLPERHLPDIHKGQVVTAYVDPYPGEAFVGKVRVVGQVIDPASRSLTVEARFENADGRLRPGLFARVEIDLGGES